MGFDMAVYEADGKYVRSPDFTNGELNYEAAEGIVEDDDDYTAAFHSLHRLSPEAAGQYVRLVYIDTLCMNIDRHTQNYGVLRDADTGEVISLAPNYDNNITLISRRYARDIKPDVDILVSRFLGFLQSEPKALSSFLKIRPPQITRELILSYCERVPIRMDSDFVCRWIPYASEQIQTWISKQVTQTSS